MISFSLSRPVQWILPQNWALPRRFSGESVSCWFGSRASRSVPANFCRPVVVLLLAAPRWAASDGEADDWILAIIVELCEFDVWLANCLCAEASWRPGGRPIDPFPVSLDLMVTGGTGGVLDTAIRWGSRDIVEVSLSSLRYCAR